MNTDKLITTLTAHPCNWQIIDAPANITPQGSKVGTSPERTATIAIRGDGMGVTMHCQFTRDLPAETAARNLNYLLVAAVVTGDKEAPYRILSMVHDVRRRKQDTIFEWSARDPDSPWHTSNRRFQLNISLTTGTTTLDIQEQTNGDD